MTQEEDFLVTHNGQEYDIQKFLRNHPGGVNYLQNYKGKTITSRMLETHHADTAMYLLREYKQGGRDDSNDKPEDLEDLVDWNKAILPQVVNLGAKYNKWVSSPVDRQLKLFENSFLENLTITPWYVVPIVWIPVVLYFIHSGLKTFTTLTEGPNSQIMAVILCFAFGIVLWTLMEYSLHRWVFHMEPSGSSKIFIYIHFAIHGLHHKVPFDTRRLVFPPVPAALIAFAGYRLYSNIFPAVILDLVVAGSISGYVMYDMIHFYLHYGAPKEDSYLYTMKRYHNQHHFSHADGGYGISNLYWDKIFGTAISLRKLAMGIKWR